MAMLGNSTETTNHTILGTIVFCAIFIAVISMLSYLIHQRRKRVIAEEWLEIRKKTLFHKGCHFKTEVDLAEAFE